MRILQNYITITLVSATFVALFALVALFSFFSVIDQLAQTGTGTYGIPQALIYVLLTVPRLAYELFPIAAVIGSMVTLGILAQNSELAVIRTSGVSKLELAFILSRAAIVLVIIAITIGELIAPASEESAQHRRSIALSEQIAMKTKYGFWARDGNSYVNIRKILPGDRIEQIYIYEFDDEDKLRSSIFANEAEYTDQQWLLTDIQQTIIGDDEITNQTLKRARWDSLLDPEMINFVIVKPQFLTIWGLIKYIDFLEQNAQDTLLYEQALWSKLIKPFSIIAMILLAILLVHSNSRYTAVGQRVFIGALVGILFHIVNQTSGHMGVVYEINPALSTTIPTILLLSIVIILLQRE